MASVVEYPQWGAVVAAAGEALPRGLLFWPTDKELIQSFLLNKVFGRRLPLNQIQDMDVYSYHPDDLPLDISYELDTFGSETWGYFFVSREPGSDRSVPGGCWKATGNREAVLGDGCQIIGYKKNLNFTPNNGTNDKFIMEEYTLKPESSLVVCRISKILREPWAMDDDCEEEVCGEEPWEIDQLGVYKTTYVD